MYGMLLNSQLSDEFCIGPNERLISPDLEERIIRFRTSIREVNYAEIESFFRAYEHLENVQGKSLWAVAEFFLEKFFERVRKTGRFDYVRYIEDSPKAIRKTDNFICQFADNGRSIKVSEKDSRRDVTQISRLVEIKRGRERQIILCDPRVNRNPQKSFGSRIKVVRELLGRGYTLSYMIVYANEMFQKALSPRSRLYKTNPMYKSDVAEYLRQSPTNLFLVYSATAPTFTEFGQTVLDRIKTPQ